MPQPQFEDILKSIQGAIDKFNRRIPSTQKAILDGIEEDLRDLDVSSGKIKATVKNLSVIARIKLRLQKIILTDDYKKDVKDFAMSFNEITDLQNAYWQSVEKKFKPNALLKEIKKQTISDTVKQLTESGIDAAIADPITEILRTNITSGGSYKELTDLLRQTMTDTNTPGLLSKYASTITSDSLNTYNAQYTATISSDLGYQWYKYNNTEILTSRPFCQAMVQERPYFHVSEIPELLRATNLHYHDIKTGEYKKVGLNKKTGLPSGMKEGTNAQTFIILRGGWNCKHQCRPVSEGLVPQDVKDRVKNTPAYAIWQRANN